MDRPAERIKKLQSLEIEFRSIILAQTNSQTAESDTRKTYEKENQTSKTGTVKTENNKDKSNGSATKPLKPFKP